MDLTSFSLGLELDCTTQEIDAANRNQNACLFCSCEFPDSESDATKPQSEQSTQSVMESIPRLLKLDAPPDLVRDLLKTSVCSVCYGSVEEGHRILLELDQIQKKVDGISEFLKVKIMECRGRRSGDIAYYSEIRKLTDRVRRNLATYLNLGSFISSLEKSKSSSSGIDDNSELLCGEVLKTEVDPECWNNTDCSDAENGDNTIKEIKDEDKNTDNRNEYFGCKRSPAALPSSDFDVDELAVLVKSYGARSRKLNTQKKSSRQRRQIWSEIASQVSKVSDCVRTPSECQKRIQKLRSLESLKTSKLKTSRSRLVAKTRRTTSSDPISSKNSKCGNEPHSELIAEDNDGEDTPESEFPVDVLRKAKRQSLGPPKKSYFRTDEMQDSEKICPLENSSAEDGDSMDVELNPEDVYDGDYFSEDSESLEQESESDSEYEVRTKRKQGKRTKTGKSNRSAEILQRAKNHKKNRKFGSESSNAKEWNLWERIVSVASGCSNSTVIQQSKDQSNAPSTEDKKVEVAEPLVNDEATACDISEPGPLEPDETSNLNLENPKETEADLSLSGTEADPVKPYVTEDLECEKEGEPPTYTVVASNGTFVLRGTKLRVARCDPDSADSVPSTSLRKRKVIHRPKPGHDCTFCSTECPSEGYLFCRKGILYKKRGFRRKPEPVTCPAEGCEEQFVKMVLLERHFKFSHNPAYTYFCDREDESCFKGFHTTMALEEHKQKFHDSSTTRFSCHLCPRSFFLKSSLQRHMRGHTDGNQFLCELCSGSFYSKLKLESHRTKVHGEAIPCPHCQRPCVNQLSLKRHIGMHHSEAERARLLRYACTFSDCSSRFISAYGLKVHVESKHSGGVRNFQCDKCPANFTNLPGLKRHMESHTGMNRRQCPHCPQVLLSLEALKNHIKAVHEKRTDAKCERCGKGFPSRKYSLRHQKRCKALIGVQSNQNLDFEGELAGH